MISQLQVTYFSANKFLQLDLFFLLQHNLKEIGIMDFVDNLLEFTKEWKSQILIIRIYSSTLPVY
jgi:hypothetical protein